MMKKRWIVTIVLALMLCITCTALLPTQAQAATYSGSCGDNVSWRLNTSTGVLTISGTGQMKDYGNNSPWLDYRDEIKRVVIEYGVTNIGATVFTCCENITSVVIPDSVTSIGEEAFYWCSGLTSVKIPNSVITIEDGAFQDCYGLENVIIGNSVTSIGAYAFYCNSLTSIEIPESVTFIGESAFCYNDQTSIEIPESVTFIGEGAFAECENLAGIWVDPRNAYYCNDEYGVLFNKDKTKLIAAPCTYSGIYNVPGSVTTIVKSAFRRCINLTGIVLPEGISSIGGFAFHRCLKLEKIEFPESLTSIGTYAFTDCNKLKEIIFRGNAPSIDYNAFGKYLFYYVTATAYYPANNDTWTADALQNYGGTLTWVAKCCDSPDWQVATCETPKTCKNCNTTDGEALGHHFAEGICTGCGISLAGDMDRNGEVSAEDLTLLARHVAGIEVLTDATALDNADVNNDGNIDANDLTMLARYVAGIIEDWT